MLHMQGDLCVLHNAAFLYFLYWVSPIKRQKKKRLQTVDISCHHLFYTDLQKNDLSKKRSKEKAFKFFILLEKKNKKQSLPHIHWEAFIFLDLPAADRKRFAGFFPFRDQKLPDPPALPPIPLRKRGRPAWGNRPGYYGAFMLPSCVVWPKQRPRVKASCKIYVHAAVSVGGKINIAGLMHGDDWVLSDWQ